MATLTVRDAG